MANGVRFGMQLTLLENEQQILQSKVRQLQQLLLRTAQAGFGL
jgi:hypothetical protein